MKMTSRTGARTYTMHYVVGGFAILTMLVAIHLRRQVVNVDAVAMSYTERWSAIDAQTDALRIRISEVDSLLTTPGPDGYVNGAKLSHAVARARVQLRATTSIVKSTPAAEDLLTQLSSVDHDLLGLSSESGRISELSQPGERSSSATMTPIHARCAASASSSKGFFSHPDSPLIGARVSSGERTLAITTGISAVAGLLLRRASVSQPLIPGMNKSRRIASGSSSGAAASRSCPLEKPRSFAVRQACAFPDRRSAPRLLLVEDDLDLARVIAASFERHGVEIIYASDGRQAIECAKTAKPDLIVLDLILPRHWR